MNQHAGEKRCKLKRSKKIIDLLHTNNINEIEYKEKDIYIRVKKDSPVLTTSVEIPSQKKRTRNSRTKKVNILLLKVPLLAHSIELLHPTLHHM